MAYSQVIADEICERIAKGETLRAICREDGKPSFWTVYQWLDANPEFATRFGRALSILQEARARGLAAEPRDPVAEAVREVGAQNRAVIDAITRAVEGIRPASTPTRWRFEIERDRSGYISAITAEAVD